MSTKELKAEIKTVQKMSSDQGVKALCDVLLDVLLVLDDKISPGFKQ